MEGTQTTAPAEASSEQSSIATEQSTNPTPQPTTEGYFASDGSKFNDGWLDRLPQDFVSPDDSSAFKTHAAKYKTPLDVIKSDFHKEKLLGRKAQAVLIPNEKSTPEEISAYRKAAGVPETADGYKLKPDSIPDGLDWNDEVAKSFTEIAHKYNIPAAAMSAIVNKHMENEVARLDIANQQMEAKKQEGAKALKTEWGQDYDKNLRIAAQAAKVAGVDSNSHGFGDPNVVKGFVRLANLISEDKIIGPSSVATSNPGRVNAMDIIQNPQNPKHQRYWDRDPAIMREVQDGLRHG